MFTKQLANLRESQKKVISWNHQVTHTGESTRTLQFCHSPAMPLRFWNIVRCGAEGDGTELACSWASWLAVVFINSMAAWRTLNCRTTAISRERGIQSIHDLLYNSSIIFTRCLQQAKTQSVSRAINSRFHRSHTKSPHYSTDTNTIEISSHRKAIEFDYSKTGYMKLHRMFSFKYP